MRDKDKRTLQKIVSYIDDARQYKQGLSFDAFLLDNKTTSACAFVVLQIGELAKELSEDVQNLNLSIPWNGIRGMRNRLVHNYENVDMTILWDTVETSLPELKNQLVEILEQI